jgi:hypothetical protein
LLIGSLVTVGGDWRIGVTAAIDSFSINSLFCGYHFCFTTTVTTLKKKSTKQVRSMTSYSQRKTDKQMEQKQRYDHATHLF